MSSDGGILRTDLYTVRPGPFANHPPFAWRQLVCALSYKSCLWLRSGAGPATSTRLRCFLFNPEETLLLNLCRLVRTVVGVRVARARETFGLRARRSCAKGRYQSPRSFHNSLHVPQSVTHGNAPRVDGAAPAAAAALRAGLLHSKACSPRAVPLLRPPATLLSWTFSRAGDQPAES